MNKTRGTKKGTKIIGTNQYSFGRQLATLRRRKGLTQTELAKMLDTTSRVISYYERESNNPSLEMVKKMANVLNVKPDSLLKLSHENDSIECIDRSLSKKFEIAQRLPQEAKTQLKKFIDTLAKAHLK
ncbi:MAG: helix-turn-helix transcriptional regulator [Chitinispirillia bacterium]|jgi:transcriptional regulator with XRE-family HTH domain